MEILRKVWRLLSMEGRKTAQSHKPEVGRESMDAFRRASSIVCPGAAGALGSEAGLHRWEVPGREVSPRATARTQMSNEIPGGRSRRVTVGLEFRTFPLLILRGQRCYEKIPDKRLG